MNDEPLFIERPCSAECGALTYWEPGQEWLRCGQCDTLNYWPGGAVTIEA